jgi:histone acetyltransferase (RNA polymerase elongator complex component)
MKQLILIPIVLALTACSTAKRGEGELEPIRNQKLSTSFKKDTIRVETDCAWYKPFKSDCDIVAIEVTATAATNGNSENNLRTALTRAQMTAMANVRHFIQEEVKSERVKTTIAKNVEKANDRMKSRTTVGEEVKMSDTDAEKDTNYSVRENSNDTAYQLTETIRTNAQGILRGFKVVGQEVTGAQQVSVTMRWDKDSDRAASMLRKKFGG